MNEQFPSRPVPPYRHGTQPVPQFPMNGSRPPFPSDRGFDRYPRDPMVGPPPLQQHPRPMVTEGGAVAAAPKDSKSGLHLRIKVLAVAAAMLVGVGGGAALASNGSAENGGYQLASYAGPAPFTAPVGADQPDIAASSDAGGEQSGATPELYAQNPEQLACDPEALISQLEGDPTKAEAWGQVLALTPDQIPTFVRSLTPVVLRADTAVTDHGYEDGTFVSAPAVLAHGTSVFINSYGEPTVKCYNGNPLTRGASSDPRVSVVVPATQVIRTIVFVNPGTGGVVQVPGKNDPRPEPGPNPTTPASPDPALAAAAAEARQKATDAATAARILQSGLNSQRADYERMRQQQNDLIVAANDPTKTPAERAAAQSQLDALSPRLVDALNALGSAATALDRANEAAAQAEADAKAAEQARDDSVPAVPGQPGTAGIAGEQLVAPQDPAAGAQTLPEDGLPVSEQQPVDAQTGSEQGGSTQGGAGTEGSSTQSGGEQSGAAGDEG